MPTETSSVEIACPTCNETGCNDCGESGYVKITDCPKRCIEPSLLRAIRLADLMKQGLPPVAGGVLDQSAWFISFYEAFRSENNWAEAETYRQV